VALGIYLLYYVKLGSMIASWYAGSYFLAARKEKLGQQHTQSRA
jgi:hypothetical protein